MPTPAYNPNIPQGTDNISTSQGQILNNFGVLESVFFNDHFPWDYSVEDQQGLHKQVTMPVVQTSDPSVSGTEGIFYTKSISGVAQPFFANSNGPMQLGGGSGTIGTNGYYTLPGGLILKWGVATVSNGGFVTYPVAYPTGTFIVQVTLNIASGLSSVGINGYLPTGFFFRTSAGGAVPITYFALGY